VSPFNGHPEGFSAATLELLDQGLNQIWLEMQIAADAKTADAKTKANLQQGSAAAPSAVGTRLEPAVPAVVK